MQYGKKDYFFVTIIGFLVGWLVLLPAKNIGFEISTLWVVISVLGFSCFAPIALFILKLLGKVWSVFEQFGKFAAVGTLNTLLDIGVLNLLMLLTEIAQGAYYSGFKAVSFLVATTNSYFWNKLWTFQSKSPVTVSEYIRFALFTLVGALINVSVASLVVNLIGAPSGFDPKLWANVGAIIAVAVSFLWNFLSYRNIVFKKSVQNENLTK